MDFSVQLKRLEKNCPKVSIKSIDDTKTCECYLTLVSDKFPHVITSDGFYKGSNLKKSQIRKNWNTLKDAFEDLDEETPTEFDLENVKSWTDEDYGGFLKWFISFYMDGKSLIERTESGTISSIEVHLNWDDDDEVEQDSAIKSYTQSAIDVKHQLEEERSLAIMTIEDMKENVRKLKEEKCNTNKLCVGKRKELDKEIQKAEEDLREKKKETEIIRGAFLENTFVMVNEYWSKEEELNSAIEDLRILKKSRDSKSALDCCGKRDIESKIRKKNDFIVQTNEDLQSIKDRMEIIDIGRVLPKQLSLASDDSIRVQEESSFSTNRVLAN